MNTGMSKRERILIIAAALITISFIAFNYLIIPLNNRYYDKLDEYEALYTEKTLLEYKFQSEPATIISFDNAKAAYDAVFDRYPKALSNNEIDRILTSLCLQNNLKPSTLGMSANKSGAEVTAYSTITATMNLSGSYESLINLIKTVEGIDYIRINQLSYSRGREADTENASISVFFEVTVLSEDA